MAPLRLISLLAANADPFYSALASYLARRLHTPVELADDVPWGERLRLLDAGEAHIAALCGLLYAPRARDAAVPLALLAAPVYAHARYAGRPVYFSDVIVPQASHARDFAALRGATLAYNDPGSFSGYALVRAELAARGEYAGFFGDVIEAGSHQAAIGLVARGEAGAAAIDTVVLEQELRARPALAGQIRVVTVLGPSPAPPLVAAAHLPVALRARVRDALVAMHDDADGRALLDTVEAARFGPVNDADYDAVRTVARVAEGVALKQA